LQKGRERVDLVVSYIFILFSDGLKASARHPQCTRSAPLEILQLNHLDDDDDSDSDSVEFREFHQLGSPRGPCFPMGSTRLAKVTELLLGDIQQLVQELAGSPVGPQIMLYYGPDLLRPGGSKVGTSAC
jgi:hypothetical protein